MFTRSTQEFGIWRDSHPFKTKYRSAAMSTFVVAMGMCALVSWLVYFLLLRFKHEFYRIETLGVSLAERPASPVYFAGRTSALTIGIWKSPDGGLTLVLDSGETFSFPADEEKLKAFLDKRMDAIEVTAMLTLSESRNLARLQIWPDKGLSTEELTDVLGFFSRLGFDDFDVAVRVR